MGLLKERYHVIDINFMELFCFNLFPSLLDAFCFYQPYNVCVSVCIYNAPAIRVNKGWNALYVAIHLAPHLGNLSSWGNMIMIPDNLDGFKGNEILI